MGIFPNKITLKCYIGRFLKNMEFILKVYFSIEHEDFFISQNLGIIVASLICPAFELKCLLSSQVVLVVKNPPPMQEIQVQSLGWEDPLEKEMRTQSSILAWKIPWTEESGGLQSTGPQRVGHD